MSSSETRTLYLIPYVHLDTQWRWTTATTISTYLPDTVRKNLALIRDYPGYSINVTGAYRYALLEEYYPDLFEQVREAVADGAWHPSGSLWEETDVLIPSAESLIRNILYGRSFFQKHFGRQTLDVMLPDSFGFHEDLPTILSHCRVNGFSTQKLSWDPVKPIPFDIGIWNGPDGSSLPVILRPGRYVSRLRIPPHLHPGWRMRISRHLRSHSLAKAARYFGNGDIGGAPTRLSVWNAMRSIRHTGGNLRTVCGESDRLFRELTEAERESMPRYAGELLLTRHSAGSLTSQRIVKRWNRRNEQLAFLADVSSVIASREIHTAYPKELLEKGWKLLVASQMHDTLPGTCTPEAYRDTYNTLGVIANLFNGIIDDAVSALARQLPLRKHEEAIFLLNPNSTAREELVPLALPVPEGEEAVILDADGIPVPCQELQREGDSLHLVCRLSVPPVGWSSYQWHRRALEPVEEEPQEEKAPEGFVLENRLLKVTIDDDGNISSIYVKRTRTEMLKEPVRFVCLDERPKTFPAWNMEWKDRKRSTVITLPPAERIYHSRRGPLLSSITIERTFNNSRFVHTVSLHHQGVEDMVFCRDSIFWQEQASSLKLSILLAFSNESASYSLDTTEVSRLPNDSHMYEFPSKGWINLDADDGSCGFSFIHGDIYGSDRPDDHTIRPTLLYTPGRSHGTFMFHDQMTQDWGRHQFSYGLLPHNGSWDTSKAAAYSSMISNPLRPYQVTRSHRALRNHLAHPSRSSFISFSTRNLDLIACKRSEEDQSYIILRVREIAGQDVVSAFISFTSQVVEAYEVDGLETPIHSVSIIGNTLSVKMQRNSIKSFAVKLQDQDISVTIDSEKHAPIQVETDLFEPLLSDEFDESEILPSGQIRYTSIPLDFNTATCSPDGSTVSGDVTFPLEQMPESIIIEDIQFPLHREGGLHALACGGERFEIPATPGGHPASRLHLVMTAQHAVTGSFTLSAADGLSSTHELFIPPVTGFIAQYDTRTWKRPARSPRDYLWWNPCTGLKEGYVHSRRIAWFTTHMHAAGVNLPHQFGYLYYFTIPLQETDAFLTLPHDIRIHLYGAVVSNMLVHTDSCRIPTDTWDL